MASTRITNDLKATILKNMCEKVFGGKKENIVKKES